MSKILLNANDTEYSAKKIQAIASVMALAQMEVIQARYTLASASFDRGSFGGALGNDLKAAEDKMRKQAELISKYEDVLKEAIDVLGETDEHDATGECLSIPDTIIASVSSPFQAAYGAITTGIASFWDFLFGGKKQETKSVTVQRKEYPGCDEETAWNSVNRFTKEVPLYGQHKEKTCGSACGSMILASLGYSVSEEVFWNKAAVYGDATGVEYMPRVLNQYLGEGTYVTEQITNADDLYNVCASSIHDGYPVQIVLRFPNGSPYFGYSSPGHYVVVTGVYTTMDGRRVAMLNDPFSKHGTYSPQQIEIPIEELREYSRLHSSNVVYHKG